MYRWTKRIFRRVELDIVRCYNSILWNLVFFFFFFFAVFFFGNSIGSNIKKRRNFLFMLSENMALDCSVYNII
jgi:hypothetical protein